MSTGKQVLVAGASGGLGEKVAHALAKNHPGFDGVKALFRKGHDKADVADKLKEAGVEIVEGDFDSQDSLKAALSEVDTVVSVLSGAGVGGPQIALVQASAAAGVKRFVPSEFGFDRSRIDKEVDHPVFQYKNNVEEEIKKTDMDYFLVASGLFCDYLLNPFFGWNTEAGTYNEAAGQEASWTPRDDVAAYVPHLLADESIKKGETVELQSFACRFTDFADHYEKVTGKKLERKDLSVDDLKAQVKAIRESDDYKQNPFADFGAALQLFIAQGSGLAKNPKKYDGLELTTLEAFAKSQFSA